jgi:hypothetical protein
MQSITPSVNAMHLHRQSWMRGGNLIKSDSTEIMPDRLVVSTACSSDDIVKGTGGLNYPSLAVFLIDKYGTRDFLQIGKYR